MGGFRLVSQITRVKPATAWYNALSVLPQALIGARSSKRSSQVEKRRYGIQTRE